MPPICDIIDSSGPAMLLASSGSADAHTVGNLFGHRIAQPLPGVQRVVDPVVGSPRDRLVVPAGSAVTPSSQVSARCTASAIAELVVSGTGATKPIELDASCRARS